MTCHVKLVLVLNLHDTSFIPVTAGSIEGMADRWLSAAQQRVWRSWVQLERQLPARLGREMQAASGLSGAEYEVLVNLSEEPRAGFGPTS